MPLTERELFALDARVKDFRDGRFPAATDAISRMGSVLTEHLAPVVEVIVALRSRDAFRAGCTYANCNHEDPAVCEIWTGRAVSEYPIPIKTVKVPRPPLVDESGVEWRTREGRLYYFYRFKGDWRPAVDERFAVSPRRAEIWHKLFTESEYIEKEEPCDFGLLEEK